MGWAIGQLKILSSALNMRVLFEVIDYPYIDIPPPYMGVAYYPY